LSRAPLPQAVNAADLRPEAVRAQLLKLLDLSRVAWRQYRWARTLGLEVGRGAPSSTKRPLWTVDPTRETVADRHKRKQREQVRIAVGQVKTAVLALDAAVRELEKVVGPVTPAPKDNHRAAMDPDEWREAQEAQARRRARGETFADG
jgi:hypothetical protein